jgi:hypothetical protein
MLTAEIQDEIKMKKEILLITLGGNALIRKN